MEQSITKMDKESQPESYGELKSLPLNKNWLKKTDPPSSPQFLSSISYAESENPVEHEKGTGKGGISRGGIEKVR